LLAVPLSNAARGDLSRLWARHSAVFHHRDFDELNLELAEDRLRGEYLSGEFQPDFSS
jgi:hypothetical protein